MSRDLSLRLDPRPKWLRAKDDKAFVRAVQEALDAAIARLSERP